MFLDNKRFGKPTKATELAVGFATINIWDCRKHLSFVKDKNTEMHFLTDSGADVCLFTSNKKDKITKDFKLYAENENAIPSFGIKILTLDMGLRRAFQWPFTIEKIDKGITGAVF